jgi:peptide chain release factor 1
MIICVVSGDGAQHAFRNESGGHRWQRVPPNEKRGRVHTSTVTVAVLPVPSATEVRIDDRDLDWRTCRGSGAGGQHRNKTESAVQLTHLPTGLMVRCESERSQHQNRQTALDLLRSRLASARAEAASDARNGDRRAQIGCGARGDKRRTLALQRDQVHDHVTDRRMPAARYLKGEVDGLW